MTTLTIQASKNYQVVIGQNLIYNTGVILSEQIKNIADKKLVLVTDSTTASLYGGTVQTSLIQAGCEVILYEIPAGETSKNWTLLGDFLEFLANSSITRSDILIALGGGVVGDFTGFAASIYQRGILFIQIPTTLLAAVDSSVGGKTAVDLKAGKNLAGTFWQPSFVMCDTNTFSTLSHDIWLDGVAESIKYGILQDADLFHAIMNGALLSDCESIIARCISIKGLLVSEDEFDRGNRELLNLGHTFGHAIETLSHYEISHGHAVAIGMHLAGKMASNLRLCSSECSEALSSALVSLGFSLEYTYSPEEMVQTMLFDKKRKGDVIHLILPQEIGNCCIYPFPIRDLLSAFHNF